MRLALVNCQSYQEQEVESALSTALDHLGGMKAFVKPGMKVLIKPNVLIALPPEAAATTHPAIISAVVREVIKAGGLPLVGDSPGNAFGNVEEIMKKTGIKQAVEEAGGKMVYFEGSGTVEAKPGIRIAKAVAEADVIINLPKLKTHGLTLYTGAVKNMFGAVPGFAKAKYHATNPHPRSFAQLIVRIFAAAKPQLNIMDAVIGMEGKGPSAGEARKFGALIATADAVALDAVAAELIGFKPNEIILTRLAGEQGLGEHKLNNIEIVGLPLDELRQSDWKKPRGLYQRIKWLPAALFILATPVINLLRANPVIDQKKCARCLICLKSCPVKTILQDPKSKIVKIKLDKCINCYCCHELCPYRAIRIERSWPLRIAGIGED